MDNTLALEYVILLDPVGAGNRICADSRQFVESSPGRSKSRHDKGHADRNDYREEYDRTVALV